jgi:hypothetical protein
MEGAGRPKRPHRAPHGPRLTCADAHPATHRHVRARHTEAESNTSERRRGTKVRFGGASRRGHMKEGGGERHNAHTQTPPHACRQHRAAHQGACTQKQNRMCECVVAFLEAGSRVVSHETRRTKFLPLHIHTTQNTNAQTHLCTHASCVRRCDPSIRTLDPILRLLDTPLQVIHLHLTAASTLPTRTTAGWVGCV